VIFQEFQDNWEPCIDTERHANNNKKSQSNLGRAMIRHPSQHRMDLPTAGSSCTMPTADKSNHSAAGTPYRHRSATFSLCYIALSDPPPPKFAPSHWEISYCGCDGGSAGPWLLSQYRTRGSLRCHDCLVITGIVS